MPTRDSPLEDTVALRDACYVTAALSKVHESADSRRMTLAVEGLTNHAARRVAKPAPPRRPSLA